MYSFYFVVVDAVGKESERMIRFLLEVGWSVLRILVILGIVFVLSTVVLSGSGMSKPSELIVNVLDFVVDQLQVIIHWFQVRFDFG
ncbi:Uncharacterised protein [Enterococcus gallinarum]|uniref:Uncharacterized protein n=2 Tax=Enterococcus TaxID=1350 RepID=A0A376GVM8_ENTGA|nr:Uncharacterised protein [Enterococcus gallinarum]STD82631.1 Uncharacterised protein [Enterococcus gallinarum]